MSVLIGRRADLALLEIYLSSRAACIDTRRRWGGIFFQDTMETHVSVTWEERRRAGINISCRNRSRINTFVLPPRLEEKRFYLV